MVFQREEELGGARVARAAGAAAKLVVDAPTLVALRADDEEAAGLQRLALGLFDLRFDGGDLGGPLRLVGDLGGFALDAHLDITAELDVGAAAGQVGVNGAGTEMGTAA